MSDFAEIDNNGTVLRVIVAEQAFINSGHVGDPNFWIQTSYNTHSGEHVLGGVPLRKNYAGAGYTYDAGRDAFVPPQPYSSWILDEATCLWTAPVPRPNDGNEYAWDEQTVTWQQVEQITVEE